MKVQITFGGLQLVGRVAPGGKHASLWALHPDLAQVGPAGGGHEHAHGHAHRAVIWIANGRTDSPAAYAEPIVPVECIDITGRLVRIDLLAEKTPTSIDKLTLLHGLEKKQLLPAPDPCLAAPIRRRWPGALLSAVHVTGGTLQKGFREFDHPPYSTARTGAVGARRSASEVLHHGAFVWTGKVNGPALRVEGLFERGVMTEITPVRASRPLELGVIFLPMNEFPQQTATKSDPKEHVQQLRRYLDYWLEPGQPKAEKFSQGLRGLKNFCPVVRLF